jgi:hypothetical protein
MWAGVTSSAQTLTYYVAASVDTVIYDSVMVSNYEDCLDSIFIANEDDYLHITMSQLELDTFQIAVLNNHRANWSFITGMNGNCYFFYEPDNEVINVTQTWNLSVKETYRLMIVDIDTNYTGTNNLTMKLE